MAVTLKPVFDALGYTQPVQQRALVKLLQASGSFGDVKGVDGMLTDAQADAIMQHITFNDTTHAINLLHRITQDSMLRPAGSERHDCVDSEQYRKHRAELKQALQDAGMISEIKPLRKHYDHVLLLGATESEVAGRFEELKKLWDEGVRFDKIYLLGSERPLVPGQEASANTTGPDGNPVTNEMGMMEAHYYDTQTRWPEGLEKARIFEVNTFNKQGGQRANTKDTVKSWLKTSPTPGDVLVLSGQPCARYQDAAVKSVLPEEFRVETVGAAAPDDIKISVAMDNLARQIDVNLEKVKQKLQGATQVMSTPLIGVDPATIKVDAATYQFRSGGDANGVTGTGRYLADHWDPVLHGDPIMLHERLDGTLYVADGHHRLELAKELNAQGKGPGNIMAMVLSEKQGYTAKDAKVIAAYKNIAHGHTDVIDTARVFKEAYAGQVHTELLPNLQMDKGNLRMAFTLSKLSDKVLDEVQNNQIDPVVAQKLAEAVPDDAARQESVMRIISDRLKQSYPPAQENKATSLNVSLPPMSQPEKTAAAAQGFVARLSLERGRAQAGVQHSRS